MNSGLPDLYTPPAMSKASAKNNSNVIAVNRRARHDYHIEDRFEAGMALEGWEVKALRAGKCNISEAYVLLKHGEAWLFGARMEPLPEASTHINPDPVRSRKLLLHRSELAKLIRQTQQAGYTCVPLQLYWSKKGLAKCEIGLAKGKQKHDKRATEKERAWNRERQRLLKQNRR
jgi:SsrA-binding protein